MKLTSAVGWQGRRGMFTSLLLVTGVTAIAVGLMMLLAAGVSLLYGEFSDARGIGAAAAVTVATGGLLRWSVHKPTALTTRSGFAGVGVAWLMMSAWGTLPYLFTGAIPDVTNAVFETVSGFTTTGALHYRALLNPRRYLANEEFRVYLLVVTAAAAWLTIALANQETAWEQAVREGVFTAVSMVTTTGYSTADFGSWMPPMQLLVLTLMTLGGMAGSTAGGIKSFRIKVLLHTALTELRRVIHPRGMFIIRLDGRPLPTHIIRGIVSYFVMYLFLLTAGALAFITIEFALGSSDLVTSASAVVASLGNIGPGLGEVGPTANYALVSPPGKWLLSLLMIVGRLEILPILVLAMPSVWRK